MKMILKIVFQAESVNDQKRSAVAGQRKPSATWLGMEGAYQDIWSHRRGSIELAT